jgi:hypothetical protein
MRAFLQRAPTPPPIQPESPDDLDQHEAEMTNEELTLLDYDSDLSSDNESLVDTGEIWFEGSSAGQIEDRDNVGEPSKKRIRRELDEPARVTWLALFENCKNELKLALRDIEKLLASRKTKFQGGENGLQSY